MSDCQLCRDTGHDLLGGPCSCPARSFDKTTPTDVRGPDLRPTAAALIRPPVADVVALEREIWDLATAIDEALRWSSATLCELANLGTWRQWLGLDGDPAMAAEHVLTCCREMQGQSAAMVVIVARLETAAERVAAIDLREAS